MHVAGKIARYVLVAMLVAGSPAFSAPLDKFFDFDTTPDITFWNATGYPDATVFSVTNGCLEQRTYSVNNSAGYAYPNFEGTGGGLSSTNATILEARINVLQINGSAGVFFQAFDGAYRYSVFLTPTGVDLLTSSGYAHATLDVFGFHTYRLESPASSPEMRLYYDGVLVYTATAPDYTIRNGFDFGDGLSESGNGGDATWDYVHIYQAPSLLSRSLTVVSAHGGTLPGSMVTDQGTLVNQWVTNSPVTCGSIQYVCTGATVAGNDFAMLSATNVSLTLTNDATLTWNWQTQPLLTIINGVGTNGLVAHWTFDDSTGKDSAGTNDAVLVGAPAMVASQSGLAMETRATAYAVADSPGLNVNGWTGITVSVWVKPVYWSGYNYGGAPGFTTYGEIIDRGTESVQSSSFAIVTPAYNHHAGSFGVNFSATNGAGANFSLFTPSTTPYPVIGDWYHLVGTYDGQYVRTYVNGVLDSSTPVSDPGCALWEPAGCKTYIGTVSRSDYRAWSDIFFSGDFDDVAIWNRGLSSNEVFQLYGGVLRSLYVSSPVGTPVPSCGTNWFISGATVTASVNAVVTLGATQYVCTGATVAGNDFTMLSATNVSLTLTNDATLTWNWQTQALLTIINGVGTNGLVAHWTFDDSTGKDSAGTNDAVLVGAPAMVASQSGLAMETRATAYAVADSPGLNVNGWTGITVSVWVKPVFWSGYNYGGGAGFATYGNILGRGSDGGGGAFLMNAPAANSWDSGFGVYFSATQSEGVVFHNFTPSKPPYPIIGNWYHLVGTYDGQTVCTYVNGVLDTSKTVSVPGLPLGEPAGCKTYLGTSYAMPYCNWPDQLFSGDYDDVAIWNRGLSPNEVFQLYGGVLRSLYVSSPVGTPVPSCGTNWFIPGATVTASVNAVVTLGTTQYVCTGVSVTGNTYTQVTPTNVSLTLTNDAALTWNWQTNYWLAVTTNGSGSVTGSGGWKGSGSNVVLTATPATWWRFTGWSGNTNGCGIAGNVITADMTQARNIAGNFVLDPHTLTVTSGHNVAWPGTLTTNNGTTLNEWVTNSPLVIGTTQYICMGAAVSGNAFTQVTPTNVSLTLTNDAVLAWSWQTNYWLAATTNGSGSVTGSGGWKGSGSNVVLTATPATWWRFTGWSGNTNGCGIAGNAITATMTQARSLAANFVLDPHTLTVTSGHNVAWPGTLTTNNGTALNEWVTNSPLVIGTTQYICMGAAVSGNAFTQVTPTNVSLTLTNDAVLAWSWQTNYWLAVTTNGSGGVTAANGWQGSGSNVVFTATPATWWRFTGWSGDTGGCVINGNAITSAMTQARNITANFVLDTRTLTVTSAWGSSSPGTLTTNNGTALNERMTSSPVTMGLTQYVCTGASLAGNAFTQVSPTNIALTLTNNATLTWTWQTNYWLATSANGNGSLTLASGWQGFGSNVTVTASSGANGHFVSWSGTTNDCVIAGNAITVGMTQARSITANFAIDQKTITVGTAYGSALPGTLTTNYGSAVSQWLANSPVLIGTTTQHVCTGASVAGNDFAQVSLTNVTLTMTNNATLTWNWQTLYLLTTQTDGAGSVTPGNWQVAGSNAVLTATADTGAHFVGWLGETNDCVIASNTLTAPMTQARAITAVFALDSETLTVISAHGGAQPGTLTTNWGASVSEWLANSPVVNGTTQYVCIGGAVAGNLYTLVDATNITLILTNNATLTWNWQTQYLLTTQTNGAGRVTPGGWYIAGSNVVLTATPGMNRHFVNWNGDTSGCVITGNVITVPMTQPRTITADFAIDQKTLTVVSARDGANPGTQIADYNTGLSQYIVNSPVSGGAGIQYVCSSGTVAGNAFTQVSPTNITLQLTHNATLTWNWQTQFLLTTAADGPGTVTPGDWHNSGGQTVLTATPDTHAHFFGWSGDTNGCVIAGNTITAPMTRARAITASFALNGETLTVVSDHGGALPGTTGADYGTVLDLRVTNSPVTNGATLYVCTGAAVLGNTFTQVSPTHVTLTLTNNATLTWNWQTNYWLGIATSGTGTVSSASGWQNASSSVVLTAVPGPGCRLAQWTGDTNGCMALFPTLTVPMTRPRAITAVFAAGATPVISGTVTRSDTKAAMAGVTISFSGVAGTAISDNSGNYSMLVPFGWSDTATASYSSGGFAKPTLTFKKITKNQAKKNFVWSPDPVISGSVTRSDTKTGLPGVTITAGSSGCDTNTDVNGNYSLTVPYNWSGVLVTAVPGGGTFKPASKTINKLTKNMAKVNFVWTAPVGAAIARPSASANRAATVAVITTIPAQGFVRWALAHGLVGNVAELFDQDADGDGISNGAEYAFGANLLECEPLVRLLTVNGVLTAEVPMQDPATLLDARESVEFALDPASGFWFPAICLPFNSQTPATKQWFQSGYGEAVEFRVRVELEK